jgi:hypothetical protein
MHSLQPLDPELCWRAGSATSRWLWRGPPRRKRSRQSAGLHLRPPRPGACRCRPAAVWRTANNPSANPHILFRSGHSRCHADALLLSADALRLNVRTFHIRYQVYRRPSAAQCSVWADVRHCVTHAMEEEEAAPVGGAAAGQNVHRNYSLLLFFNSSPKLLDFAGAGRGGGAPVGGAAAGRSARGGSRTAKVPLPASLFIGSQR